MIDNETTTTTSVEHSDLLEALAVHRQFLRGTADGLTDDQARARSTVSELSIGGIIKHVATVESEWADFMINGAAQPDGDIDWSNPDTEAIEAWQAGFRLGDSETLAGVLDHYEQVAAATDRLVVTIDDLNRSFPLPASPWFEPGAERSVRRAIVHIIAETTQHAGHADIIREAIDGTKSMG